MVFLLFQMSSAVQVGSCDSVIAQGSDVNGDATVSQVGAVSGDSEVSQ